MRFVLDQAGAGELGPASSLMTPACNASSSVRYSFTLTLSLAARRVKKKLMSMAAGPTTLL
jgi:hypothetical protein